MNASMRRAGAWLWLTLPIAILLAAAAAGGLLIDDLYNNNPYYVAQAKGQDLISLVVAVPTLIITALVAARGSFRAWLVWLGALVYVVYTYVVAAFDNNFNSLFLVYVALLGSALYALIGSLATMDLGSIKAHFGDQTPARAIAAYLAVLAVLFYFLWLGELVPAILAGEIPQSVSDNGTATNAVHVLDMAWILPALLITAFHLWRKRALGYTLAATALSYIVLLVLSILSMVVAMIREGQPVVVPQVAIFAVLFVISLGMLVWFLGGLESPRIAGERALPA